MSQYIRRHPLGEPFHPFRIQIRKVIVRRPGVGIFMGGRFIHQFRNKPEEKKGHPRGVPLREDRHGGKNLILLPQGHRQSGTPISLRHQCGTPTFKSPLITPGNQKSREERMVSRKSGCPCFPLGKVGVLVLLPRKGCPYDERRDRAPARGAPTGVSAWR